MTNTGTGYSEGEAWRWLRRWPRLHLLCRANPEPGMPPPPKARWEWPLEHHLTVLADIEVALEQVPEELRWYVVAHYRDDWSGSEMCGFLRGRVRPDVCLHKAKAGARVLVAWLSGGKEQRA